MKDSTVIIVILAGAALLFWAVSTGLIQTTGGAVRIGNTGIVAPQPNQNYSGYLAASTAPGVSGAINNALSGIGSGVGNLFAGWFGGSAPSTTPPNNSATPNSPAMAAQPSGPGQTTSEQYGPTVQQLTAPVGPVVDPQLAYAATAGSAFDYTGLSSANSYDSSYSLTDPAFSVS